MAKVNYNVTKINNFFLQNQETDFLGLKGKKIKIQHLTADQFLEDKTPRGSTCNCIRHPDIAVDNLDISAATGGGGSSRSGSANCMTVRTRLCLTTGHTLSKAFTKRTWTRYDSRRHGRQSAPTLRAETATPIDLLARSMTPQPIQTPLKDWNPLRGEKLRGEIAHIHMGANSPRNRPTAVYGNNGVNTSKNNEDPIKNKYNDKFPKKGSNNNNVTFHSDRQIEVTSPRQKSMVSCMKQPINNAFENQIIAMNSKKQSKKPLPQTYSYS